MGAILDDLDGHEGYPLRQLPDGTTTSRWTSNTTRSTECIAECDCGSTGTGHYEPTEAGYDAALDEWEHDHARPFLEDVIPQHLLRDTLRALDDVAAQRPHATARALRHSTPGVRPSDNYSTSGRSPTSHRRVDRRSSGNSPAAALASRSSHEQVQVGPGAHAIGTGPASPDGRAHLLGENR